MAKNYYDVLGVSKSASEDEIKRAYRKLASEHHPDRGGNAEQFKEINEAYQVLSNKEKRGQYDQYGQTFEDAQRQGGFGGGQGGYGNGNPFGGGFDFGGFQGGFGGTEFDFGDIFSNIFGGGAGASDSERRTRGVDLEMPLHISFEESISGAEKEVVLEKKNPCPRCGGNGAEPGSKIITCPKCHGSGQIKTQRRTILGTIATAVTCDRCEGIGKVPEQPCTECKGTGTKRGEKKIKVSVPAGIADGQRLRVSGEGEAGYRGSANGDLYILIRVKPNPEFQREGYNLHKPVNITFSQAALGDTIEVKSVKGPVKIKIPAGTQSGKIFRVSGYGVPYLNRTGRGDMFVNVTVKTPEKLSKKQKELLKQLAELDE